MTSLRQALQVRSSQFLCNCLVVFLRVHNPNRASRQSVIIATVLLHRANHWKVADAVSLPRKYGNRRPRYWRSPRRFFSPFGDADEISKRHNVRRPGVVAYNIFSSDFDFDYYFSAVSKGTVCQKQTQLRRKSLVRIEISSSN